MKFAFKKKTALTSCMNLSHTVRNKYDSVDPWIISEIMQDTVKATHDKNVSCGESAGCCELVKSFIHIIPDNSQW